MPQLTAISTLTNPYFNAYARCPSPRLRGEGGAERRVRGWCHLPQSWPKAMLAQDDREFSPRNSLLATSSDPSLFNHAV
jgi:hypothetical protein